LEFQFDEFLTAEFSKKFPLEYPKSETELEFCFRWGSQKLESNIGIPNLAGWDRYLPVPLSKAQILILWALLLAISWWSSSCQGADAGKQLDQSSRLKLKEYLTESLFEDVFALNSTISMPPCCCLYP
jgi:hypothetical protein